MTDLKCGHENARNIKAGIVGCDCGQTWDRGELQNFSRGKPEDYPILIARYEAARPASCQNAWGRPMRVYVLVDADGVAHIRGPESTALRDLVSRSFRRWQAEGQEEVSPVPGPGEMEAFVAAAGDLGFDARTRSL